MKQNTDNYLDLKALAAYSCLSVHTLRNYISASDDPLPSFCVCKKILVRKSEFDRWMDSHRYNGSKLDDMVDEIFNDLQAS